MENCVPKCVNVFVGEFTPQIRAVNMFHHEKTQIYVPERTCRDIETRTDYWQCSECGVQLENPYECPTLWDGYRATSPLFCPNCGARVVY